MDTFGKPCFLRFCRWSRQSAGAVRARLRSSDRVVRACLPAEINPEIDAKIDPKSTPEIDTQIDRKTKQIIRKCKKLVDPMSTQTRPKLDPEIDQKSTREWTRTRPKIVLGIGQKSIKNWPQNRSQNRHPTRPKNKANNKKIVEIGRPNIDPKSTQNWPPNRPKIDPQIDPKSTQTRPKLYSNGARLVKKKLWLLSASGG